MANRQTTFLLKRSNVPGKIPSSSGITSGELALNTADAILYTSGSTSNSILPIGWDRISRTGDTVTGDFLFNGNLSATTISATTYLNLPSTLTATSLNTDYIDFNTGATVTTQFGRINWDSGTGTLNIGVGDSTTGLIDFQVGQEEVVRVFNEEATTLQKGEIVYVFSSQGNRPSVKRAVATSDGYSVTTLGMVAGNISSLGQGYVTTFGIISNLNTLGLSGGTPIWLSPTTPGGYTSTKPQAPNHTVLIGYVVRVSATVGSIFVNISNGWELDEIHDVRIIADTEGDLLMRSSFSGTPVWVNTKTLNGSYTITGNTNIGGNLTVSGNSGVNWFSSNTSSDLVRITQIGTGNAFVVEDNTNPDSTPFVIDASGNTGIGTTAPLAKLDVSSNSGRLRLTQNTAGNVFNGIDFVSYVGGVNGSLISNQFTGELRLFTPSTYFPTFYSSGNEIMRISTSGNVGIGTISPREKLDVSGNTIISSGLSASTVTITTQPTSGYTSTQILMRNSTSGQVEITDSTSPSIYNYGMTYAMTTFNYLT